jgi:hypothetical protein
MAMVSVVDRLDMIMDVGTALGEPDTSEEAITIIE